ncbi:MAG: hypothetical protein ABR581_01905 [Thermoleophilaceae bacterium]
MHPERSPRVLARGLGSLAATALTLVAAALVGFGIPAGWLWVGSQLQTTSGGGGFALGAVAIVFAGILGSYFVIMWLLGIVAARRLKGQAGPRRYNWNRSMRDERHRAPTLNRLETVFVTAAVVVGFAYMVWFLFFAGSSLPSG